MPHCYNLFHLVSHAHTMHRCFVTTVSTKFSHLLLRKVIKILATRCQILRQKCNKLDFGWALSQTPLGGLTVLPLSWI